MAERRERNRDALSPEEGCIPVEHDEGCIPVEQEGSHVAETVDRGNPVFARISDWARAFVGSPKFAVGLLAGIVAWAISGFIFYFSRPWELIVTTGAPILALVLLVLLQHTQNRDDKALQLKLDEVIRASNASDRMMAIEDSVPDDLHRLHHHYKHEAEDSTNGAGRHQHGNGERRSDQRRKQESGAPRQQ